MNKLILAVCIIGFLLVSPTEAMCENSPLCELGGSIVEQMSLQVTTGGRIAPVILTGSMAFVEECPSDVISTFRRFEIGGKDLHGAWIEALRSEISRHPNSELSEFIAAAKVSVNRNGDASLEEFLDGPFKASIDVKEEDRQPLHRLFEEQSLATLRQFPHCDAAECYDVSDFLLFLLGAHPAAFFMAMHEDQPDATKWLSELGDLSFTGEESDRQRRDSIRRFLLERISKLKAPSFPHEKSQCENVLRQIRFRAWK